MTWWQMLICFWVYGTGARVDALLSKDAQFGFWLRQAIKLPFTVGAFLLVDLWAGVTW